MTDLGTVLPGSTLPGSIRITNPTGHAVRVTDVRTSCSCTGVGARAFEIPAGGTFELPVVLTPGCPGRSSATVRLVTDIGDPTVLWIEGACRHPFVDAWEPIEDGARVALAPDIDPAIIERVTCYWYPRDEPLGAAVVRDPDGAAWLVVAGDPPDRGAMLDIVYTLTAQPGSVAQRTASSEQSGERTTDGSSSSVLAPASVQSAGD